MQDFMKALTSERKSTALPEEFDYFGKLIGSWQINYVESNSSRVIKGEWHFSRVLEGMAVQDVIILLIMNTEPHFVSSIPIHTPGMSLMVIRET